MSRPVPKPRTRTLTRSGELASSPSATRSEGDEGEGKLAPSSPQEAWVDSAEVVRAEMPQLRSDANMMYTNDDEDEEFEDSLDFYDLEEPAERPSTSVGLGGCQMQGSRFHPEDTLQGFTSQAPFTSLPLPPSTAPVRTSPTSKRYQEESKLLLREVTDLKNHKISLSQEIATLSDALARKREDIEELEHKLQSREKSLRDREQLSAVEKGNIDLKMKKIALKEKELEDREKTLLLRQHALDERESLLVEQEAMASGAAQLEKERSSLRVREEEMKKRDEALHKWSRELHEEAERLRLKEIEQNRDIESRLAALSILQEESQQQGGERREELVGAPSKPPGMAAAESVVDPKLEADADMAARLQQELWQVCVCIAHFKSYNVSVLKQSYYNVPILSSFVHYVHPPSFVNKTLPDSL